MSWLWFFIGFGSAFVVSFGAMVGWWFLLSHRDANWRARAQAEFDTGRNAIRSVRRN